MTAPTRRASNDRGGQAFAVVVLILIAALALGLALYAVTSSPDRGPAGPAGEPGPAGAPGVPGQNGAGLQPGTVVLSPGRGGCPVGTQAMDPASYVTDNHDQRYEVCQVGGAG